MLSQEFHIKYLSSNSVCSHITISSGFCIDEEKFKQVVYSCLPQCMPITIQANGLGIFVKEEPVIYIRWLLSRELFGMCRTFQNNLIDVWTKTGESSVEELWLPKTTLALKDTSYEQLPLVLKELKPYDFGQSMVVDKLAILEVSKKEILVEEIRIH
jgi:2'-5' RNA ligase